MGRRAIEGIVAAGLIACAGPASERIVVADEIVDATPTSSPPMATEAAAEFGAIEPAPFEGYPRDDGIDPSMLAELRSVTLRRGGCYGTCPIYSVTITRDGELTWLGERFVPVLGRERARIARTDAQALFLEILSFDYTHAPSWCCDNTCKAWGHDGSSSTLDLDFDDHSRQIPITTNCIGNPVLDDLIALANHVDAVVDTERWLNSPPRKCVEYLWAAGLSSDANAYERERTLDDVVSMLEAEQMADFRLVIHTTASLRDRKGAAQARAEAFIQLLSDAGIERSRIDVVDEGTDLAEQPANSKHSAYDEQLLFRFVRDPCP